MKNERGELYREFVGTVEDVKITSMLNRGFFFPAGHTGLYHDHACFELHFIISGCGRMQVDGEEYDISEGSVLLIPPHRYHALCKVDGRIPCADIPILFSYERADGAPRLRDSLFARLEAIFSEDRPVYILRGEEYRHIPIWISDELRRPSRLSESMIKNGLEGLYLRLISELLPSASDMGDACETRTQNLPELSLTDIYLSSLHPSQSLRELSELLCLSERSTQRLMRRLYGMSFSQKLSEVRTEQAALLIREGQLTMAEIAARVGYSHYTAFFAAFKKRFGITPSDYEKNIRKERLAQ